MLSLQLQEGLQLRSRQLGHVRVQQLLLGPLCLLRLQLLELLLCGPWQVLKLERSSACWAGQPEVGSIILGRQCLLQPCASPQGHIRTRWPFHTLQAKGVPLPCQTHQNAHSILSCTNPTAAHPHECCCCCCTSLLLQCLLLLQVCTLLPAPPLSKAGPVPAAVAHCRTSAVPARCSSMCVGRSTPLRSSCRHHRLLCHICLQRAELA